MAEFASDSIQLDIIASFYSFLSADSKKTKKHFFLKFGLFGFVFERKRVGILGRQFVGAPSYT